MKVQVKGRIEAMKNVNGNIQTILATPAPDSYTQPQSYLLRSAQPLGQPGQEVNVVAEVRGFVKKKPFQNKNTGMQDEFWESNVYFDAQLAPAK